MHTIFIEFYGRLSDTMGAKLSCELESAAMTIAKLRVRLADDYDNEELLKPSIRAVINDQVVQEDAVITPGDSVAFLSPLSGG